MCIPEMEHVSHLGKLPKHKNIVRAYNIYAIKE